MKNDNRIEFVHELIDLAAEQLDQLRKEIHFYRASIYKNEMSQKINERVAGLNLIFSLLSEEKSKEHFENYQDEIQFGRQSPSEDYFSSATLRLASCCQNDLELIKNKTLRKDFESQDFTRKVRSARKSLARLCSDDSSSKSFFSNL